MKTAGITEMKTQLSALLDRVRHGETILIVDRGRPVARLEPIVTGSVEDTDCRLARLERQAAVRPALQALPETFLGTRPPRARRGASIVKALIHGRREGR